MKKMFYKIAVATIFMAVLLINTSSGASKGTEGNEKCPELTPGYIHGKCFESGKCSGDAFSFECSVIHSV